MYTNIGYYFYKPFSLSFLRHLSEEYEIDYDVEQEPDGSILVMFHSDTETVGDFCKRCNEIIKMLNNKSHHG